jgi:hypothetical protein
MRLIESKVEKAKRLLLQKGCMDRFTRTRLTTTAKTVDIPKFMPFSEDENRRDFLRAIKQLLPKYKCLLKVHFDTSNSLVITYPEDGFCKHWDDGKDA